MNKIKALRISEDDFFSIRLSLEEALINAIRHGNKNNPDLSVEVDVEYAKDKLIMQVKNQGEGFDFQHLADPTQAENLDKLSGRGIFLIRNMMDNVEFTGQGRVIKMVKLLKGGPR